MARLRWKHEETPEPCQATGGSQCARQRGYCATTQRAIVKREWILQLTSTTFQRGVPPDLHWQRVSYWHLSLLGIASQQSRSPPRLGKMTARQAGRKAITSSSYHHNPPCKKDNLHSVSAVDWRHQDSFRNYCTVYRPHLALNAAQYIEPTAHIHSVTFCLETLTDCRYNAVAFYGCTVHASGL